MQAGQVAWPTWFPTGAGAIKLLTALSRDCYNTAVTEGYVSNDGKALPSDEAWMRQALAQAELAATEGEVPVGAVAVFEDQIIGRGYNRKESDQDPTAHAEMAALRAAAKYLNNWRLIGVTLYCTLEPCPMCAGAMIQARLGRLVYGAPDIRFGAVETVVQLLDQPAFNHRVEVQAGVLQTEAAELLQSFFRRLRTAS